MTPESQIKQYTIPEFAARIRQKYPEYKDLSDDDLTMRVLTKHPEYKTRVNLGTVEQAQADVARIKTQFDKAAQSYMSAAGKTLNPTVTPGTDYFRPLTPTEQAAQKRGEPVIISEAAQEPAVAPERASRPRLVTEPPVSLAPVIQSRLEQIQTEKRRRELQAKVEQARQVRQRVPRGLVLPPGQRNQGAAYKPKFGLGETYKEVPKLDKSVPQVADYLAPEQALTFAQDRARREKVKQQMTRLEGRAGAASDYQGEEYQNFLRLNRSLDSPKMREDFLTLKAKQEIERHGSIAGALLAEDEEAARRQRIAQMGRGEYLAQIPKSAVTGLAAGAGTTLKGLATASKALVDRVIDTGGLETKDTDVYRLGEYITEKSKELVRSNPDLEQEFWVGKAPDTIGQSALFLLGGWATQSPKVAVTILGAGMTAGDAYDEVKTHGGSEDQAVNAGLLAGALLGPTELIGMRGAMKAIEGTVVETTLKAALKTALREGRRDVIENALQEVGQEAAQGLITGNPRTLNQLAEAGILGAIGGLQTIPTSLGASAIETARQGGVVDNYIKQSPLSTTDEKAAVKEAESSNAPIVEPKEVKPVSRPQAPEVVEQALALDHTLEREIPELLPDEPIRAYHGSPHEFGKFTLQKIGEGEGDQAYGWGLYFTGNRGVAEYYREVLSEGSVQFTENNQPAKIGKNEGFGATSLEFVLYEHQGIKNRSDAIAFLTRELGKPDAPEHVGEYKAALKLLTDHPGLEVRRKPKGKVYTVGLAPKSDEWLDWDKSLGEQSPRVQKLLKQAGVYDLQQQANEFYANLQARAPGSITPTGRIYPEANPRKASKYLRSIGIRGIRYFTGETRNKEGGKEYNYVLFDDRDVRMDDADSPSLPPTKPTVTIPAEVKTQSSATESQLTTPKEVTDEVGAEIESRPNPVATPKSEEEFAQPISSEETTKEQQFEPEVVPETKQSKLAQGVESKAIEAKLTAGFQGLPEYETVKVADQARMAAELLKNDPEQAKRVAMGQRVPEDPKLLPESVFVAVEADALQRGDVDTLRELATTSTLSMEATGMGQRIRMLAERNPYSPVTAIKEIQTAREKRAKQKMGTKAKEKVVTEIKTEIRKAAPKAKDWKSFLEEIKCK